ncbi:MAG: hypothetical protein J0H25_03550, partial [Rhizobiales bacterium]|nr:hypothetical protein [Hyphomicrobiales bacterium]
MSEEAVERRREDVDADKADGRALEFFFADRVDHSLTEIGRRADVVDWNEIGPVTARVGDQHRGSRHR